MRAVPALGASRQYTGRQEHDRVMSVLRDTIGIDELAKLMLAGAAMSDDQVIEGARSL
jgi:hypothetical protein